MIKKVISIIFLVMMYSGCMYTMSEYNVNNFDMPEYSALSEKEEHVAPERITQFQHSAQQIPEVIADIQQKVTSNRNLENLISQWENILNEIKQIAFLLQDELYAKVASREQFKDFYTSFTTLANNLNELNKKLIVPEFGLQDRDTQPQILYQKAVEILQKILQEIAQHSNKNFFDNLKKIKDIYAQMAAGIKKEQEEKEVQARAEQEQTDMVFDDLDYSDYLDYDNYSDYDNYNDWSNE